MVWVPYEWLNRQTGADLCSRFTVTPRAYEGDTPEPIHYFKDDRDRRLLGLPIHEGLKHVSNIGRLDQTFYTLAEGLPIYVRKLPDPNHPKAPEGQGDFMEAMVEYLDFYKTLLAKGDTGIGKTVCVLNAIGRFGVTALVIVPSKNLAAQWRREITMHLGIPESEIGVVEEGKCIYKGKAIVVAVIHNLCDRDWPREFYEYFGFVAWDECHMLGARFFSKSISLFPSKYKIAVSATPERRDGCDKVFLDYFGSPMVTAQSHALPMDVVTIDFKTEKRYPNSAPHPILLNHVAADDFRNNFLAYLIEACFNFGRQTLIISDRIKQLQRLMYLCTQRGIPETSMGFYARSWTEEIEEEKIVDGKPKLVKRQKKHTFTEEQLAIQEKAELIFATYGMMRQGKDIPRLDTGIDATPRSEGRQVCGRIRRRLDGKPKPVWFTLRDLASPKLRRMTESRLTDYQKTPISILRYGPQTLTTIFN